MLKMTEQKTKVVNKYKEPYDIYIGRGSKFGNPFSHRSGTKAKFVVKSRDEAIEKYKEWIQTQPHLMESLEELRGKVLGCFCKPKKCHGDVLVSLLEGQEEGTDEEKSEGIDKYHFD